MRKHSRSSAFPSICGHVSIALDEFVRFCPRIPPIGFSREEFPCCYFASFLELQWRFGAVPPLAYCDPGSSPQYQIHRSPHPLLPSRKALCLASASPPHPPATALPRVESTRLPRQLLPASTPPSRTHTTLEIRCRPTRPRAGRPPSPPRLALPGKARLHTVPGALHSLRPVPPPWPISVALAREFLARASASPARSRLATHGSKGRSVPRVFFVSPVSCRVIIPEPLGRIASSAATTSPLICL